VSKSDSGVFICIATSAGMFDMETNTTLNVVNRDCSDIYKSGKRSDGIYTVDPDGQGAIQYDMTTDGGGWTVFQRRQDGSVNFYREWQPYKTGFGNLNGEFWLGNDFIHRLTARAASTLRVDMEDWAGNQKYAKYGSFSVADESDKYRLIATSFSGDAGDGIWMRQNNSTKDQDNDIASWGSCAVAFTGGWWYGECHQSNLNGRYLGYKFDQSGINWYPFDYSKLSLKSTTMKLRPKSF
jgi:ficolin